MKIKFILDYKRAFKSTIGNTALLYQWEGRMKLHLQSLLAKYNIFLLSQQISYWNFLSIICHQRCTKFFYNIIKQ